MGSCHRSLSFFYLSNLYLIVVTLQLNKPHANGVLTAYLKGAPERVLAKCTTYLKDGQQIPITADFQKEYDEAYDVSLHSFLLF